MRKSLNVRQLTQIVADAFGGQADAMAPGGVQMPHPGQGKTGFQVFVDHENDLFRFR